MVMPAGSRRTEVVQRVRGNRAARFLCRWNPSVIPMDSHRLVGGCGVGIFGVQGARGGAMVGIVLAITSRTASG